ncbi:MAG: hypothetical protein R3Y46_01145 [Opitutales bacterium]
MFKKILVLCVFMFSCVVWAGNSSTIKGDKEESLESMRNRVDNLKKKIPKLDYSYESHTDIPYDLYGDNKHANRLLPKEDQAKYYADPLAYMESVAQADWQRAFEMSMYYQGWKPNTIFFRFDFLMSFHQLNSIPTTDDMRFDKRKIISKEKALYWAEIAYGLLNIARKNVSFYEGLGSRNIIAANLFYRRVDVGKEDFVFNKEIYDSYDDSIIENLIWYQENCKKAEYKNIDISKYEFFTYNFDTWRNFYSGFVYPKDKDIAFMSLFMYDRELEQAIALCKIQSGLYDKSEKFEKGSKRWKLRILNILHLREINSNYKKITTEHPINKYATRIYSGFSYLDRDFQVYDNPLFDKEKALEEAKKIISNYTYEDEYNYRHGYGSHSVVSTFIKYTPFYGIDEDVYNEILEIFYTNKETHRIPKKYEAFARTWFNGQASHWQDYR